MSTVTKTIDIRALCSWSEPKRVNTRNGPMMLSTAPADSKFWELWRQAKLELKGAGVSCGKSRSGEWEACWWQPLSPEVVAEQKASQDASRATNADINIPVPEGLEYLDYQKAGIAYCLRVFGDL
jgi:hypothetical protein